LISFGTTAKIELPEFSADAGAVTGKINGMAWQKSNTNTAEALSLVLYLWTVEIARVNFTGSQQVEELIARKFWTKPD